MKSGMKIDIPGGRIVFPATEPMPEDFEISAFMNKLEATLSDFHDAVCPQK